MAHWAELDKNNTVIRVVVTDSNDPNGDEGYEWLKTNLGGNWIKTSYNTIGGQHILGGEPLRKNFAGAGFKYDETRDAFIPPKTYASWVLNEDTCLWESPVPKPSESELYYWDEDTLSWKEIITQ